MNHALKCSALTVFLSAALALVASCAIPASVFAGTLTWTGAGDGTTFGQAQNWSPVAIPSTTSDCVIPAGAKTIAFQDNAFLNSLSTARNMLVDGCSRITLKAGLTISGGATFTLNNTGGCTAIVLDGGTQAITGSGQILVTSAGINGAILDVRNNADVTIGAGITLTYAPGSTGAAAKILVNAGCSLTNLGQIALTRPNGTLSITGSGTFTNSGWISASTGTFRIDAANWFNAGSIQTTSAQLYFLGSWTNSGSISTINSSWNVAGTYPSLGTIHRSGGTISLVSSPTGSAINATASTGNISLTGLTLIDKSLVATGGASFSSGETLTLSNCSLSGTLSSCGTVTISGGLSMSSGLVTFAGCFGLNLIATGPAQEVSGNGEINLGGSLSLDYSAALTLGSGIKLTNPYAVSIALGSTLTNNGTIVRTLGGSWSMFGQGVFANAGTLQTEPGGTFSMQVGTWSNSGIFNIKGSATFTSSTAWNNSNSLVFEGPSVSVEGAWTNTGIIDSKSATTSLAGAWSNAGLIKLTNAATSFDGTYGAIGQVERSGGSLTLNGVCSAPVLEATATTGSIALGAVQLNGCSLRASGGAALTLTGNAAFTACTLETPLPITSCGSLSIASSLTLANGASITVVHSNENCPSYALRFGAGVIAVQGTGSIEAISDSYFIETSATSSVTFGAGITLLVGPAFTKNLAYFQNIGTIVNRGILRLDHAGTTLSVPNGTFRNLGLLDVRAGTLDIRNLDGGLNGLAVASGAFAKFAGDSYSINLPPTLAPNSAVTFSGNYKVNCQFQVTDATVEFRGTWSNLWNMSLTRANVRFDGTWSNLGSIHAADSTITLGGTYPSLGTHDFTNIRYIYSGTLPTGVTLTADASTGDIGLQAITLNSATLRTLDGAKFYTDLLYGFSYAGSIFNSCTIDGDLAVQSCDSIRVSGGLALVEGSRVFLNTQCNVGLLFQGAPQSISGHGEFIAVGQGNFSYLFDVLSELTMESGITLRVPPEASAQGYVKVVVEQGRFINRGSILLQATGREFYVAGRFQNQGLVEATAGTMRFAANVLDNLKNLKLTGGNWRAINAPFNFEGGDIRRIGPDTEITLEGPTGVFQQMTKLDSNEGVLHIRARTQPSAPVAPGLFTNSGTLDLASDASFSITGAAAFTPSNTLRTEVAGLIAGQVGRFTATGPISFAGKLQGSFAPAYNPINGDITAPILESPQITGAFASYCFDSNPFALGVLPRFEAGPPNQVSLEVSESAGIPVTILHAPVNTSATPSANFHVEAGPANATYEWKRDGEILVDGPTEVGSSISGATTPDLVILHVHPTDAGDYTVTVSTPCAAVTTDPAHLQFCYGDFNSDIIVDDADFGLFVNNYNIMDCADSLMPQSCPGDFNFDGVVDDSDFVSFLVAYDYLVCPTLSVCRCQMPEPGGPPCDFFRCR
ncbi:MAG: hypothetical protein ACREJD_16465 [Phycisphaerales bacterium]